MSYPELQRRHSGDCASQVATTLVPAHQPVAYGVARAATHIMRELKRQPTAAKAVASKLNIMISCLVFFLCTSYAPERGFVFFLLLIRNADEQEQVHGTQILRDILAEPPIYPCSSSY